MCVRQLFCLPLYKRALYLRDTCGQYYGDALLLPVQRNGGVQLSWGMRTTIGTRVESWPRAMPRFGTKLSAISAMLHCWPSIPSICAFFLGHSACSSAPLCEHAVHHCTVETDEFADLSLCRGGLVHDNSLQSPRREGLWMQDRVWQQGGSL